MRIDPHAHDVAAGYGDTTPHDVDTDPLLAMLDAMQQSSRPDTGGVIDGELSTTDDDPRDVDPFPFRVDELEPPFLLLYDGQDEPWMRTAREIAADLENFYHAGESGVIEWVLSFDPATRRMQPAQVTLVETSIQRDERDGAPIYAHHQLRVCDVVGAILATAQVTINLDV